MLPSSYRDKIRQIEGVQTVSWGNWFGGIYIDEKNFFPNFAVEPKTYLELYPEYILSDTEKKAFLVDRKGFIAGRKVAQRFGWKVGDTVTLKGSIFPGNWDFTMRGIYRGRDKGTDDKESKKVWHANSSIIPWRRRPTWQWTPVFWLKGNYERLVDGNVIAFDRWPRP